MKKKAIGYQATNKKTQNIHPEIRGSFCVYSYSQCLLMVQDSPKKWNILPIYDGDIKNPTIMFESLTTWAELKARLNEMSDAELQYDIRVHSIQDNSVVDGNFKISTKLLYDVGGQGVELTPDVLKQLEDDGVTPEEIEEMWPLMNVDDLYIEIY